MSLTSAKNFKVEAELWYLVKRSGLNQQLMELSPAPFCEENQEKLIIWYKKRFTNTRTTDDTLRKRLIAICNKKFREQSDQLNTHAGMNDFKSIVDIYERYKD